MKTEEQPASMADFLQASRRKPRRDRLASISPNGTSSETSTASRKCFDPATARSVPSTG